MSTVTKKTFNKALKQYIQGQIIGREALQELLNFGFKQVMSKDFNASPLSDIVTQCKGVKSVPTVSVMRYIMAHMPLKFTEKEGVLIFRKVDDADYFEPKKPTMKWYDYDQSHNDMSKLDAFKMAKALIAKLEKPENHDKLVDPNAAKIVADALKNALSQVA
jgi:hypothetical protein